MSSHHQLIFNNLQLYGKSIRRTFFSNIQFWLNFRILPWRFQKPFSKDASINTIEYCHIKIQDIDSHSDVVKKITHYYLFRSKCLYRKKGFQFDGVTKEKKGNCYLLSFCQVHTTCCQLYNTLVIVSHFR